MLLGCVGAFWAHQCCCEDRSWAEVDFVREPRVSRGPQLVITAHDFRLVRGREGMYYCVGGRMLIAGGGCAKRNMSRTRIPVGVGGWALPSVMHLTS